LAQKLEKEGGLPPTVNVDGPYGLPFAFRQHTKILLMAGGIGITPLHSILRTLLLLSLSPEGLGNDCCLKAVRLVWSVRDRSQIALFKDTLERAKALGQNSKGVTFDVEVFSSATVTAADEDGSSASLPITQGRTNVVAEVAHLAADGGAAPLIYVCGPEALVREVKAAAIAKEVAFSNETFLL
jgi:NAD(P)H-flavin reductase